MEPAYALNLCSNITAKTPLDVYASPWLPPVGLSSCIHDLINPPNLNIHGSWMTNQLVIWLMLIW